MQYENVTAIAAANVYFDGKVISHAIILPDGSKKTLGVILPGEYHFGTEAAELMEIVGGGCSYVLDGTEESQAVSDGSSFNVPANSGFTITVTSEPCHYVCSFL
ncbi:MAG: pyrimidine/purine nucleoside phosphorylase [Roseibacillus sp.]